MKRRYSPFYFIGQAFRSLWRNGVMSFASIAVLMSCLVVMGGFALLVLNIDKNLDQINLMNEIVVFCNKDATEEEIVSIEEQIKALSNVQSVERVTKAQALQKMKDQSTEYENLYDDITDENNPLTDSFQITYSTEEGAATLQYELKQIEGVRKVNARIDLANSVANFKSGIQLIFIWLLAILFVVTIFIIINTIKLTLHSRRHEISVMRYVGATGWFITLPFVFEGIIIGLFASGIAFGMISCIYGYIEKAVAADLDMLTLIPLAEIDLWLLLGFVTVGVITGIVGSCISIGKYLKS